jgi:large subunit ribosomal protein L30
MSEKKVRITLIKSSYGRKPRRAATLKALGLHRINQSVVHTMTPQIEGMAQKVIDLVSIEETT